MANSFSILTRTVKIYDKEKAKSYLLKLILTNLRESGKRIICLDPESEYEEICSALGGCYIDFLSGEYTINPLEPKAWSEQAVPAPNSRTNTNPPFETQKKLVDKLVKIYPDSKELFEYEDYLSHPTRENADELIMRIAEMHSELFGDREKYVKYGELRIPSILFSVSSINRSNRFMFAVSFFLSAWESSSLYSCRTACKSAILPLISKKCVDINISPLTFLILFFSVCKYNNGCTAE